MIWQELHLQHDLGSDVIIQNLLKCGEFSSEMSDWEHYIFVAGEFISSNLQEKKISDFFKNFSIDFFVLAESW